MIKIVFRLLFLTVFSHVVFAGDASLAIIKKQVIEDELRKYEIIDVGDYRIKISGLKVFDMNEVINETAHGLKIYKSGKIVLNESQGFEYFHNGKCMKNTVRETCIPDFKANFTGEDIPVFVFTTFSGGAHCCFTYHFYSLGQALNKMAEVETEDGYIRFKDIDGDSVLELIINDWSFGYQWTSFAFSPAPDVVLKWTGNKYEPDIMLMKKPYNELVSSDKFKKYNLSTSDKYKAVCDLIYTGNGDKAWDVLYGELKGAEKSEAIDKFKQELSQSKYWTIVKKMNSWD